MKPRDIHTEKSRIKGIEVHVLDEGTKKELWSRVYTHAVVGSDNCLFFGRRNRKVGKPSRG